MLHILISAVIPYGNSRFRVLVEPFDNRLNFIFHTLYENKNSTI